MKVVSVAKEENPLILIRAPQDSTLYQPPVYPLHRLKYHASFAHDQLLLTQNITSKLVRDEIFPILGCYTEIFGNMLSKYRDYVSVQSSSVTPRNNQCRVCVPLHHIYIYWQNKKYFLNKVHLHVSALVNGHLHVVHETHLKQLYNKYMGCLWGGRVKICKR